MFIVNKDLSKSNIPRTIRFTEEIYNSLSDMASHEDISFNQLVLQCCRYAIDNYGTTEERTESGVDGKFRALKKSIKIPESK